jgi:hypothetical protein
MADPVRQARLVATRQRAIIIVCSSCNHNIETWEASDNVLLFEVVRSALRHVCEEQPNGVQTD